MNEQIDLEINEFTKKNQMKIWCKLRSFLMPETRKAVDAIA